jgi:hypothetical protein
MRARSIQSIASRFGHTLATDEGWGVPRTRLARRSRQSNPTHATGLTGVAAAGEEEALVRGDVEAEQRRERGVLLVPVEGAGLLPVPLVPVPRLPVRLRRRARHRAPSLPPRCRPDLAVEPACLPGGFRGGPMLVVRWDGLAGSPGPLCVSLDRDGRTVQIFG